MKVNLTRYSRTFAFVCMTLFNITIPAAVSAEEVKDFVDKLKENYQNTLGINTFSLKYHFLNKQYRDNDYWDYQTPNRVMSQRMVEVDLAKKHFYDNDILYYSGGRLYDRAQFQNDTESFFYEKSTSTFGKSILNRGMDNFDRFISYMVMNIDFLAVRPLLEESNIEGKITLHQNKESGVITLTHKVSDDNIIDYEFRVAPLQLVSVNKKSQHSITVYDDYQTTRGLTFARSVNSFLNGATEPAYIKFIDQFDVIEQVEPGKLRLPSGYDQEIPKSDGVLVSKEIAKDLYLVTDSSARRNSLLKVNGDEIMLFGASGYTTLAKKMLKLISEQFPKKTITSVYVTHPHGHQVAGLKVYAEKDIEILADEYTLSGIKAYPRFADNIARFKFRTIKNEQVIKGTHFYVLENMHSKRQGFVYFKDSGVIFQSHFLHIPFDNTIAKVIPNYTRTFIDFVRSKQLKFNRIVASNRNNNISNEVMNKTYEAMM